MHGGLRLQTRWDWDMNRLLWLTSEMKTAHKHRVLWHIAIVTYAGVIQILLLTGHLYVSGVWLGEYQTGPQRHVFESDWTFTSSNFVVYSIPIMKQEWEYPDVPLRNQQTCTFNNHN